MTLINIRGTNGSGKSTVVKSLLARFSSRPIFGFLGMKYPEAYELNPGKPVGYVIGPYHSLTGGLDAMSGRGLDVVIPLLDRYRQKGGHLIFEGVLISMTYGSLCTWLEPFKAETLFVFLNTPLDECLDSIRRRREGKPPGQEHVAQKFKAIEAVRQRLAGEGWAVETVGRDQAVDTILERMK